MALGTLILLIIGILIILLGMGTLINPNLARWINLPGGPHLKAIISIIVGIIIIILGLIVPIPMT